MKCIYPSLSNYDLGLFRIGGAGLANCMYVAARAYSYSLRYNAELIEPTWEKISIGPILRGEQDKRHYIGLFDKPFMRGLKKLKYIHENVIAESEIERFESSTDGVLKVSGLGNYFQDLNQKESAEYFNMIIKEHIKKIVDADDFENVIAVHVRLGDYSASQRTPIPWYSDMIKKMSDYNPDLKFYIFSDGKDEELESLIELRNVERKFFGNALADILAISRCKLVLASDSTFSAWGAFLGNVPVIFPKRHFPPVFKDNSQTELVIANPDDINNALDLSLIL